MAAQNFKCPRKGRQNEAVLVSRLLHRYTENKHRMYIFVLLTTVLALQKCRIRSVTTSITPQTTAAPIITKTTTTTTIAPIITQAIARVVVQPKPQPKILAAVNSFVAKVPRVLAGLTSSLSEAVSALKSLAPHVNLPSSTNFQSDCLNSHNILRALVNQPPLTISASLVASAQLVANHLAATDTFEHSHTPNQGENLFQSTNGDFSTKVAMQGWFDEFTNYNGEPIGQGNFEGYGHFTQVRN